MFNDIDVYIKTNNYNYSAPTQLFDLRRDVLSYLMSMFPTSSLTIKRAP